MLRKKGWALLIAMVMMTSFVAGCGGGNGTEPAEEPAPVEEPSEEVLEDKSFETDVLVVGAGAAGLAAAMEAAREGVDVVLIEKLPMLGGSTLLSGGIMYAAQSPVQERAGVEEGWEDLAQYWIEMAEGDIDEELISYIAEHSGDAIKWLEDQGVEFSENLSPQGISPALRGHVTEENRGAGLIVPLEAKANELGVDIRKNTAAIDLVTDADGNVVGAEVEESDGTTYVITAKSIVLATGGFDRSEQVLAEYSPVASDQISYTAQGNAGDGLVMARGVGADIVSKNGVIGFRGVAEDLPYTNPLGGLVFVPNMYVDDSGNRFTNEAGHYALLYKDMMETGSEFFYSIFSGEGVPVDALEGGIERGFVVKGDSFEELAEEMGVPAQAFLQSVDRYNELALAGEDADFGNPAIAPITDENLYALKVSPAILGTFGGPRVNLDGQVLDIDGNPIRGLYAVGEVANGQLYKDVYPASGTSITAAFVLGRTTGVAAANNAK